VVRLRIGEDLGDAGDEINAGRARARSLSNVSVALGENLTEILGRLRPFLLMLSLVDLIKTTWSDRVPEDGAQSIQVYHEALARDYLAKENLVRVVEDSNLFFKSYDEKLTKIESVEGFLN